MRHAFSFLLTLAIFVAAFPAVGQDPPAPPPLFTDQAEVAFVDTSGNTEVTSLAAKNALTWNISSATKFGWKVQALYAEAEGETTAESYGTDVRLERMFSDRLYGFGAAGWLRDEFAGFDARLNAGAGVGYKVLTGPRHLLQVEGGGDYVSEEYVDGTDDAYAAARGFGLYEYVFAEKNKFGQALELIASVEDADQVRLRSETSLTAGLTGALSMKAGYVVRYNNQPVPESFDKTDTMLSISLVANF